MSLASPKILILGAGKMTEAILAGLHTQIDFSQTCIYSPSGESARKLSLLVGASHVTSLEGIMPDWILIGCKPQQLPELKKIIGDQFQDSLFVSMLAALPETDQCRVLGIKKLVRIMPNLPVKFKQGITLVSSQSATSEVQQIQALFAKLGDALIVKEEELEELTLLTGSGPAFYYEFTLTLASSFSSLDQKQREKLARHVLLGAATSAAKDAQPLPELINAVTSKGGVTIAVLENWRENQMVKLVQTGIAAGKKRSQELKKLILQS